MADAFFQALYCQPVSVFGRELRPFSLSHSFLLSELKNGWVTADEGLRSDLMHAVWLCSKNHAENQRTLLSPPLIRLAWFALKSKRYDYAKERNKFLQYLSDYTDVPQHWHGEATGKAFLAPWQFHFAVTISQNCGLSINEAWDMPVALARCYYDIWAEQQGDESLVSVREKKLAEAEGIEL